MARNTAPIPRRRTLKRFLLLVASLTLTLALGEIVLQVLGVPSEFASFSFRNVDFENGTYMMKDRELFWRLRPDAKDIFVNRLQLRGWAPAQARGPMDLRIACVGDSCTFGLGVRYEETYGLQLEAILRRALPGACVETLLAGVPGYSTWQTKQVMATKVRPLRPDITILYCGAYNDYLGAVGSCDTEMAANLAAMRSSPIFKSHVVRLLHTAATRTEPDLEAFQRGEFADGPRVPLPEFRKHLSELIRMGREHGGEVIAVIPPIPESTLRRVPSALAYRSALFEVYARESVPVIDAAARFAELERQLPSDWGPQDTHPSILYLDFVHPSPCGHGVIARALANLLLKKETGRVAELKESAAPGRMKITAVYPERVPPHSDPVRVQVQGSGFRDPAGIERIWLGERFVTEFKVVDDANIVFLLPARITGTPGAHAVTLISKDGITTSDAGVEVTGMPLQARMVEAAKAPSVEVLVGGPPGANVRVWFSATRRERPFPTINGVVELPGDLRVGLPEFAFPPFRWESLDHLTHFDGVIGENGRLHWTGVLPEAILTASSRTLFVQAVIVEGEQRARGVLSFVARVDLPR
jgi:lysophospholipase L1-like esterase